MGVDGGVAVRGESACGNVLSEETAAGVLMGVTAGAAGLGVGLAIAFGSGRAAAAAGFGVSTSGDWAAMMALGTGGTKFAAPGFGPLPIAGFGTGLVTTGGGGTAMSASALTEGPPGFAKGFGIGRGPAAGEWLSGLYRDSRVQMRTLCRRLRRHCE